MTSKRTGTVVGNTEALGDLYSGTSSIFIGDVGDGKTKMVLTLIEGVLRSTDATILVVSDELEPLILKNLLLNELNILDERVISRVHITGSKELDEREALEKIIKDNNIRVVILDGISMPVRNRYVEGNYANLIDELADGLGLYTALTIQSSPESSTRERDLFSYASKVDNVYQLNKMFGKFFIRQLTFSKDTYMDWRPLNGE